MSWNPRTTQRLTAIDAYRFPAAVRHRFAAGHDSLTAADVDRIEAATRQWFRLAARHPRARLAMPSSTADALWRELARQTTDYATFCAQAFGRDFPPGPSTEPNGNGATPPAPPVGLAETYRFAVQDEGCAPGMLPRLFRVDRELAVPGGRRYLADCGGRGTCHDLPGAVCLQHLQGAGKGIRGRGVYGAPPSGPVAPGGGGSCGGGGCGGG